MKFWVGCAVAALALACTAGTAFANNDCTVSGVLQAGGGFDATGLNVNVTGVPLGVGAKSGTLGPQAFGEIGMIYQCSQWGGQIDAALYDHWANINTLIPGLTVDLDDPNGHIGGAVWANFDHARLGIAGSYILNSTGVMVPAIGGGRLGSYDTSFYRIGGFGEYYVDDKWTFGAGAFYVGGDSGVNIHAFGTNAFLDLLDHSGFEGNLSAKYYASRNVSLSLRGDLELDTVDFSKTLFIPLSLPLQGYALTAEAEYLVPNSPVSVAVGGRYGYRQLGPLVLGPASAAVSTHDEQAYVSVKIALGGPKPTSLVQRDRSSGYDNTSVMKEKLPSFVFDLANSALTP